MTNTHSGGWWGIFSPTSTELPYYTDTTYPAQPGRLRRRIVIEEYDIVGEWDSKPVHRCPLTEAKPGEVMMYYCPECNGAWC